MRCGVCGAQHASCGPTGMGTPVTLSDLPTREQNAMSELAEYTVTINGVETTCQMTAEDAERQGAVPVGKAAKKATPAADEKEAPAPADKARKATPNNKSTS